MWDPCIESECYPLMRFVHTTSTRRLESHHYGISHGNITVSPLNRRISPLNIHPSHKIVGIDIMNDKIWYCKYCWIYATHPEIEKPCYDKPDPWKDVRYKNKCLNSLDF